MMKTFLVILVIICILGIYVAFGSYCEKYLREGGIIKEIYLIPSRKGNAYWIVITDKDKHYLDAPPLQIKGEKLIYEDFFCVKLNP